MSIKDAVKGGIAIPEPPKGIPVFTANDVLKGRAVNAMQSDKDTWAKSMVALLGAFSKGAECVEVDVPKDGGAVLASLGFFCGRLYSNQDTGLDKVRVSLFPFEDSGIKLEVS